MTMCGLSTLITLSQMKKRLDVLLVERGLADWRAPGAGAQLSVPGHEKAGEQVDEGVELVVERPPRYVSRGGEKLEHALETFGTSVDGLRCLDVGASTGGFTDCLLQHGAAHVVALDVGYGQLHSRLRDDPRVTVLERVNARHLPELPYAPDLVTCDVSFISLRTALPPALARPPRLARASAREAAVRGRAERTRSAASSATLRFTRGCCATFRWRRSAGTPAMAGIVDSGLPGPKGNRGFFLHLVHGEQPTFQMSSMPGSQMLSPPSLSVGRPWSRTASRRRSGTQSRASDRWHSPVSGDEASRIVGG